MQCPHCRFDPIPEGVRECPQCHRPFAADRAIHIDIQTQQNQGKIVAVQAEHLNGNIYDGNVIYVLNSNGRSAGSAAFFQRGSPPYKRLAPYAATDAPIFRGREEEIRRVLLRIAEQPVVSVYGAAGVGKSSLLAAGLVPGLAESGALAVLIQDFTMPVIDTVRDGLAKAADVLPLKIPEGDGLAGLVRAIRDDLQGTVVLLLDHVEAFFQSDRTKEPFTALAGEIARAIDAVGHEYLRVIIAIDGDFALRLQSVDDHLPGLLRNSLELLPLAPHQARSAILEPLGDLSSPFHYEVGFNPALVDDLLIADLDELSYASPGRIAPLHLQIVCDRLYREARERNMREINQDLYLERLQGADGILASFLHEQLALLPEAHRKPAQKCLAWLARQDDPVWRVGDGNEGAECRVDVLAELASCGLLAERVSGEIREFTLITPAIAPEIRAQLGGVRAGDYDPQTELGHIWSARIATGDLPGEGALLRLEGARKSCRYSAAQALLLLRGAAACHLPLAPWLGWLKDAPDAPGLVKRLEGMKVGEDWRSNYASHIDRAERLLRFGELPQPPGGWNGKPYGRLSWAAVRSTDPAVRQSAVVALSLLEEDSGLTRVEKALRDLPDRARRRIELHGTLLDAGVEVSYRVSSPLQRAGARLWRAGQRLVRDRQRVVSLTLAGGLGAGLGLGLLRGLSAALAHLTIGLHASMNFGFGFLLGAALIFGMLFTEYLLLQPPESGKAMNRAKFLAFLLGGASFGLAGGIVSLSTGSLSLAGKEMVLAANFEAGLCLAVSLLPFPFLGNRLDLQPQSWPWRILLAGALFSTLHSGFLWLGISDLSAVIIWPGALYRAELERYASLPVWRDLVALPGWYNGIALLDAFFTGAVLCTGILLSIRIAAGILRRWRSLIEVWSATDDQEI